MAEKNSSTPERELLKIIEDREEPSSIRAKKSIRRGLSFFSLGGIKGRFSFFKNNFKKIFSLSLDIKSINRFLTLFLLIMLFLFGFNFLNSFTGLKQEVDAAFKIKKRTGFKFEDVSVLKKPAFYLEEARKRDIFKMASQVKKEKKKEPKVVKKKVVKEIAEKTKALKLVGIAWSADPDVMIEDTESKKTFFLKRGDFINDVEVAGIFKDKVILRYKGEEIELK